MAQSVMRGWILWAILSGQDRRCASRTGPCSPANVHVALWQGAFDVMQEAPAACGGVTEPTLVGRAGRAIKELLT